MASSRPGASSSSTGRPAKKLGEAVAKAWAADNPGSDEAAIAFERKRLIRAPAGRGVVSRAAPHPKIPEWEQVLSPERWR